MNNCPKDVIDYPKSAPNFHRVDEVKICYFCAHNKYGWLDEESKRINFFCKLHHFPFGNADQVPLQVEFTCDDWKSEGDEE